jgi:hypothetical protein
VNNAIAAAERIDRDLEATLVKAPVRVRMSAAAAAGRSRGVALLATATEKIRAASRTSSDADLAEAGRLTEEAATLLGAALAETVADVKAAVARELATVERAGNDAVAAVEARVQLVERGLLRRPSLDPALMKEFTAVQETLARSQRAFAPAIRAGDLLAARKAAAALPGLVPQLDALAERLGLNRLTVPDQVRNAAQALFDGRYRDVVALLPAQSMAVIEMPFKTHAHVIRAAALFALYEYSGAADRALVTEARRESDACRSLDPDFRPDPQAFSPRFIAFFLGPAGPRR